MENELKQLIEEYLEKYQKYSADLFTVCGTMSDEDFIQVLREAKGRRIVIEDEQNDADDAPISWHYE